MKRTRKLDPKKDIVSLNVIRNTIKTQYQVFTQIQETGLPQKAGFFTLGSALPHAVFGHES